MERMNIVWQAVQHFHILIFFSFFFLPFCGGEHVAGNKLWFSKSKKKKNVFHLAIWQIGDFFFPSSNECLIFFKKPLK